MLAVFCFRWSYISLLGGGTGLKTLPLHPTLFTSLLTTDSVHGVQAPEVASLFCSSCFGVRMAAFYDTDPLLGTTKLLNPHPLYTDLLGGNKARHRFPENSETGGG